MATDTVTIEQFAKVHDIGISAQRADVNPTMTDSRDMDHWKVTLSRSILKPGFDTFHGYKGKLGPCQYRKLRMTLYFSKGYGHNGAEPTIDEVLDCLASDALSVDNARDFENFASELGYDSDSRKAEKIWKACNHQAERLRKFLGDDLYQTLLLLTEIALVSGR